MLKQVNIFRVYNKDKISRDAHHLLVLNASTMNVDIMHVDKYYFVYMIYVNNTFKPFEHIQANFI